MARTTILATGLQDRHPPIDGWERDGGYAGPIRFCPICDGFEALDKRIGILGGSEAACRKAIFMRTYSQDVTLFATHRIDVKSACKLDEAGIQLVRLPCTITRVDNSVLVATDDGRRYEVDVLYPAMGSHVNSGIASALGAKCDETGLVKVDEHQHTNVEGLYAVGDVVTDLHQINVGTAHAAVAATAIHNRLPPNPR